MEYSKHRMVKKLQKNKAEKENINREGKDYLLKIKLSILFNSILERQ